MTEFTGQRPEVDGSTKIKDIPPIQETAGAFVRERDDLLSLVEPPLLPSCLALYDLNIKTFTSSANAGNLEQEGHAVIGIDYSSLSERNQQVAETLGVITERSGDSKQVYLDIPLDIHDTVSSVQQKAAMLAEQFHKQKMRWVTVYTFAQMKEWMLLNSDAAITPQEIADVTGLFLDPTENNYYLSEEQYMKAHEDVEGRSLRGEIRDPPVARDPEVLRPEWEAGRQARNVRIGVKKT